MPAAFLAMIRGFGRLHRFLLRRVGGPGFLGRNMLLLSTRGRVTGRWSAVPLLHAELGQRLFVVPSLEGSDDPPRWYLNLSANPDVIVERNGTRRSYRARTLESAESVPIWPLLLAICPSYAACQRRTRRRIPIVELRPEADEPADLAGKKLSSPK